MSGTYKLVCPHCQNRIRIRTSVGQHELMRTAYLQCTNEGCGFTAVGSFEITHEMSASGMPNPAIQLPVANSALRRAAMKTRAGEDSQTDLFDELEADIKGISHG